MCGQAAEKHLPTHIICDELHMFLQDNFAILSLEVVLFTAMLSIEGHK
jgi:hypothetical protein